MGSCLTARSDAERPVAAAEGLLRWFDTRERDVPWRDERDPYRIWVAEVMAQQTRMETVGPYYRRFIERFPTPAALASASLDEVLKLWEGLGYYARARHLHSAAGEIVERHGGRLPESVEELRALSGIGPYTAGAVASIAFGIAEPAVDGNARRVLSRLFDLDDPAAAALADAARSLLAGAPSRPAAINQAIMDLGGAVCTPRDPLCPRCPIVASCLARARRTVALRPARKPRKPTPVRRAASAILWRGDEFLLVRRPPTGLLGGLWDLPGTEPVEAPDPPDGRVLGEALSRRFGVQAQAGPAVATVRHAFSHFRLVLDVLLFEWEGGEPSWEHGSKWASPDLATELALPTYLRTVLPPR
ncbi:MAG: A/G-specific adenine glycosylase [Gemmatimonadota bacterium]|nr:A/G-specific adenine glycosylase [Gemmatimonadota bacterium]